MDNSHSCCWTGAIKSTFLVLLSHWSLFPCCEQRGRFMDTLFLFPSSLSLFAPSPSSSLLLPQHPYLKVDLQKNNRNHCFTRWHSTDHSGLDSLQAAGVIWSTRPGPLRSQPHSGHSQCHGCVSLSLPTGPSVDISSPGPSYNVDFFLFL